jgi:hypothetical protein
MTPFFYNGGSDPRNVKMSDKVTTTCALLGANFDPRVEVEP